MKLLYPLCPLVNAYIATGNHNAINGKPDYFYGHGFKNYLGLPEGITIGGQSHPRSKSTRVYSSVVDITGQYRFRIGVIRTGEAMVDFPTSLAVCFCGFSPEMDTEFLAI